MFFSKPSSSLESLSRLTPWSLDFFKLPGITGDCWDFRVGKTSLVRGLLSSMLCSFPTLEEALRVAEIRQNHRRALSDGTVESVQGRWLERKCLHLRRWFLCRCWFSCIGFIGFFVGTITTTLWGGRPGKRKWSCCTGGGCDGILCMCAVRSDRHLGMFFGEEKLMQLLAEVLGLVILRQQDLDILLLFFFLGGVGGG